MKPYTYLNVTMAAEQIKEELAANKSAFDELNNVSPSEDEIKNAIYTYNTTGEIISDWLGKVISIGNRIKRLEIMLGMAGEYPNETYDGLESRARSREHIDWYIQNVVHRR